MKKSSMMLLGGLAVVSAIAISKPSMAETVSEKEVDVRVDNESKKAEVLNGLYENSGCVKLTQAEIEKMSKMEKMESVTLQGISIEKLDMSKAKKLKTLVLDNCDTKSLKVTKNKKLTKIVIRNTKIKTLDLSQNKELTEVAVQNGEESYLTNLKTGEVEEKTFFKFPEQSCKVKFAAKNKIKKLESDYQLKAQKKQASADEQEEKLKAEYKGVANRTKKDELVEACKKFLGGMSKADAINYLQSSKKLQDALGVRFYDVYYLVRKG